MKKLIKFITLALLIPALISCDGTQGTEEEGKLTLTADKNEVSFDEKATFTVKYNDNDVTSESVINNISSGEKLAGNEFSSDRAGTAIFRAEYKGKISNAVTIAVLEGDVSGLVLQPSPAGYRFGIDKEITFKMFYDETDVTAKSKVYDVISGNALELKGDVFVFPVSGVKKNMAFRGEYNDMETREVKVPQLDFYKKTFFIRATGTWCGYCYPYAKNVEDANNEYPDRMVHMAAHNDDEMENQYSMGLISHFGITGFPRGVWDYSKQTSNATADRIVLQMKTQIKDYPPQCGISAVTSVEGNNVKVKVKVAVTEKNTYALAVALTEHKVTGYPQWTGSSYVQDYEHNYTLRNYATVIGGDPLGELAAGDIVEKEYTLALEAYNRSNCEVVIYVNTRVEGTLMTTNTISVPVGETQEFRYE